MIGSAAYNTRTHGSGAFAPPLNLPSRVCGMARTLCVWLFFLTNLDYEHDMTVLAFDLDDTLLNSDKKIGAHTKQVLCRWLGNGNYVFLATSRPMRAVKRFVEMELLERCYNVTLNGAVWQFGLEKPSAEVKLGKLAKEIVEHPILARETHLSIEFYGHEFATNAWLTDEELAQRHSATPDMVVPLHRVKFDSVSKVAIDGLGASLLHHMGWIRSLGGRAIPAMNGTFLNVVDASIDKSVTLQRLLDSIGIAPEDLVAFGDDIPDLGMLNLAGVKVAMGNATTEVKEIADHVIADCNSDAIGRFIEQYF